MPRTAGGFMLVPFAWLRGERTGRYLERQELLVRDLGNSYLALEPDETRLEGDPGRSIT